MSWIVWPEGFERLPERGHLVIEASAGTGKTYTLEHLVVRELVRGVPIEKMVIVTFTDRATEELRARVRKKLEEVLRNGELPLAPGASRLEPAELRAVEHALARFDRAPISTFHAFCQRILSEQAFTGGRSLGEALMPGARLHALAFRRALSERWAVEPGLSRRLDRYLEESGYLPGLADNLAKLSRTPFERLSPAPSPEQRAALAAGAPVPGLPERAAAVLAFMPSYLEALRRVKAELSALDYDDLVEGVCATLEDPARGPALVAALRARYELAMIDEFQDTDASQWSLFSRVFGEAPHRLVLIGDPKQAIYGFRGADVRTYHRAVRELEGRAHKLRLEVCHRATAKLIDEYNALLEDGVLREGKVPPVRPKAAPPVFEDASEPRAIVLLKVPGERASSVRHHHACFIAEEIARLMEEARFEGRALTHGDVFVLTHTQAEALFVGDVLRAHGIPIAYFKPEGLFATDEALAWREVLRFVRAPERGARKALLSPFFEVPLARVGDLDAGGRPLGASLAEQWRRLAAARDYGALFSRILDDSGVLVRAAFDGRSERRVTNLLHLAEILLEETERERPSLDDLIAWLDRLIEGVDRPTGRHGDVQRLEGEAKAVQLMTVHKSKGLEATVVFLFGGYFAGGNNFPPFAFRRGEVRLQELRNKAQAEPEVRAAIAEEEAEELGRLAYVAVTRAKARVYIPARELRDGDAGGRNAVLERRIVSLVDAKRGLFLAVPDAPPLSDRHRDAASAPRVRLPEIPPLPEAPVDFAAVVRDRAGDRVTSYTRMKREKDEASARDAALEEEWTLGEAAQPAPLELLEHELPPGPETGVFLHQLLERVPLGPLGSLEEWRARPEVEAIVSDALVEHRIDPKHRAEAERLVHAGLSAPLPIAEPPLAGVSLAREVAREMEFLFPWPGQLVKGYLDVVLEHGGRYFVVDWKSDRLPDYSARALAEQVEARYRIQVQLYSLALARILGEARRQDFGGVVYVFLRGLEGGGGVYVERPSEAERARWATELGGLERANARPQLRFGFLGEDDDGAARARRRRR